MNALHLAHLNLFLWLLVAHALCDYPLQGDFLARAKNQRAPIPGVPWYQALAAHAVIHAGVVLALTGSLALFAAELLAHAAIDYAKSAGVLTFNEDQAAHVACKVAWVWALALGAA